MCGGKRQVSDRITGVHAEPAKKSYEHGRNGAGPETTFLIVSVFHRNYLPSILEEKI